MQSKLSIPRVVANDTQVSQLSIRDNYRLGKYQPNHSRSILVKMTRSSKVSSILYNRHKQTSQPVNFIKADLSPKERLFELLLLKERRSLIELGVDRSGIKISNLCKEAETCQCHKLGTTLGQSTAPISSGST